MKKYLQFLCLTIFPTIVFAQFAVVSTQPANNAKNVPLNTTMSITFTEALDTNWLNSGRDDIWFSNIDSVISETFSADLKTVSVNVVLKPNRSYFSASIFMKAKSGAVITTPHVYYFTTGADFAPYTVSGTVLSGSTGVSPERSIVALTNVNIMEGGGDDGGSPPFSGWANVNSNGTYTIPNISNGTYWPLAAKDVNGDGRIDIESGVDVMAFGDSIIVNNASLTNINLTFISFTPKTFHEVTSIADSLSKTLPADKVLRRISGWDVDTLGRSNGWEFAYTHNNNTMGKGIRVSSFNSEIYSLDQGYINWIKQLKPITNYQSAASSATVIANVENAGGKAFRLSPRPDSLEFRIELTIHDQKNGRFWQGGFDTSKIYWAVSYTHVYQPTRDSSVWVKEKHFLCDLTTGAVILVQPTRVKAGTIIPELFSLYQNYPNPFNPTTNISFTVPVNGHATLKVYNMLGQEVAVLFNGEAVAGNYNRVVFNGSGLASGLYFSKLEFNGKVQMKKMMLIK